MLSAIKVRLRDGVYSFGLCILILSVIVFCIPIMSVKTIDDQFGFFMVNFVLAGAYFLVLWGNGRLKKSSRRIHTFFIFLLLALVSAYSLNRELTLFEDSATWFCITLVLVSVNYLAFSFLSYIPVFVKHVMSFILGISTLVFTYLSIYLLPYYSIGVAAFFVLGISLHTFVPLLFGIYSVVLLRRVTIRYPYLLKSFLAGILSVILLLAFFIIKWNSLANIINHEYRTEVIEGDESLPAWVRVSQKIPKGWLTEKILKTGLVYEIPSNEEMFWRMPQRNFGEQHKHDPIVMVSSFFTQKIQLSEQEKINILKSMYDSRHEAEERLWSGENLVTSYVNTNIKLWPEYRMAYTEKVITVTNNKNASWASEEAIYTFHLPEGGVVTSLSLWINGREAKGVLTTKEKAAKAYNTIVGVENRDPSVVQWQEGNRVSVRVFPVTGKESRMFKIGITSPLELDESRLRYSNIYFDGPLVNGAKEDIKIDGQTALNTNVPDDFNASGNGRFTREGNYVADWNLSCDTKNLSGQSFNFDGFSYAVQSHKIERQHANINSVYLDINSSWTNQDVKDVFDIVKQKNVFVNDEGIQRLTESNAAAHFENLQKKRFSLFPFYLVNIPAESIVITKNEGASPNLDDIKESNFYRKLNKAQTGTVKLFSLNADLSPYLKTLKELRWFQYEQGGFKDLQQILSGNVFDANEETNEKIVIHTAGVDLVKAPTTEKNLNAPDHLMRLFTYNHLMKEIGRNVGDSVAPELIAEAQQAYIVSPVSSLVVLETEEDYKRFDITDNEKGLKDATLKSNGAVPEPHKWALIVLALIVGLYIKYPFLFKRSISRS